MDYLSWFASFLCCDTDRRFITCSFWCQVWSRLTSLCFPPAAGHDSVLHHDPPVALPRQTHHPAVGPHHLHHTSSQIPGAAQPSAVLEERHHLPLLLLAWCTGSRDVCVVNSWIWGDLCGRRAACPKCLTSLWGVLTVEIWRKLKCHWVSFSNSKQLWKDLQQRYYCF